MQSIHEKCILFSIAFPRTILSSQFVERKQNWTRSINNFQSAVASSTDCSGNRALISLFIYYYCWYWWSTLTYTCLFSACVRDRAREFHIWAEMNWESNLFEVTARVANSPMISIQSQNNQSAMRNRTRIRICFIVVNEITVRCSLGDDDFQKKKKKLYFLASHDESGCREHANCIR